MLIPADIEAETMDQTEYKTAFLIQEDERIAKPVSTLWLPTVLKMTKLQSLAVVCGHMRLVGYLMSDYFDRHHQTAAECVDGKPEYVDGESANDNPAVMILIRALCDRGVPCPPYHPDKAITCLRPKKPIISMHQQSVGGSADH
ncbi:uncharacterized protein [Watersipora subatra]|uniref:uncharacterized protein n=1 Tax=Watersipora subatra TaxID=2589382 RepID=UPI00355C9710